MTSQDEQDARLFAHLRSVYKRVEALWDNEYDQFRRARVNDEVVTGDRPIGDEFTEFSVWWASDELDTLIDALLSKGSVLCKESIDGWDKRGVLEELAARWPPLHSYCKWMGDHASEYPAVCEYFILLNYIRYCLIRYCQNA